MATTYRIEYVFYIDYIRIVSLGNIFHEIDILEGDKSCKKGKSHKWWRELEVSDFIHAICAIQDISDIATSHWTTPRENASYIFAYEL
jgi:hypothetical protein